MNNLIIKTILCAVMFLLPAKILLIIFGGAFYMMFY